MSNNQGPSFDAHFELDIPPSSSALATEHCRANRVQIENIGRRRHEQVRIEFLTANGNLSAIYTVSTFHNDVELVSLGDKIKNQFANCQLSKGKCQGKVKAQIMIEGLEDPDTAEALGELIEYLSPVGQNHKLVVIAPHGGHIEPGTDDQAEYVWSHLSQLSPNDVTLWMCRGFSNPHAKDAHERWHITSTEISERSFPKLNTIIGDNPTFDYSIAFHGWTENSICVGGNPDNSDHELKCDIKHEIKKALTEVHSDIEVYMSPCPEGNFNGDNPENIVNRLGTNSIQIEQCRNARDDVKLRDAIAQAVVNVMGPRINA